MNIRQIFLPIAIQLLEIPVNQIYDKFDGFVKNISPFNGDSEWDDIDPFDRSVIITEFLIATKISVSDVMTMVSEVTK